MLLLIRFYNVSLRIFLDIILVRVISDTILNTNGVICFFRLFWSMSWGFKPASCVNFNVILRGVRNCPSFDTT
jgi:hypothetical protein